MCPTASDSPRPSRSEAAQAEFRQQVELLTALGKSLHEAGLPAHRLEAILEQTAARLGVPIHVFSLPTGLMLSIGEQHASTTVLVRLGPGVVHLERLAQLSAVARGIARGVLDAEDAKRYVDRVMRAPARYGRAATVLAYVFSAAAFAVFFGGALPEVIIAVCVGLAVGLISVGMQQFRASRLLFELTAAAAAAAIANIAHVFRPTFVDWIPLASGLIILLPGLALVDAVDELAHGHLTSGASRLAGVGAALLAMTFGAVVGAVLIVPEALEHYAGAAAGPQTPEPRPLWWVPGALLVVAIGSTIRFRARYQDVWVALAGSVVALSGASLGAYGLGRFAGPFVAAFLLGAAARLYGSLFRQPAQLLIVPGLALLVPGSFGLRSVAALLSNDTTVGVDIAFDMFLAAMALVSGLLFSNTFFRETEH